MPIKSVKMKISKNKKMRFFLISQGSLNPKIRFLAQKLWSVARVQRHRQTDTKETTVGTLSGFQEFSLQPIIEDRWSAQYRRRFFMVSGWFSFNPTIKDRALSFNLRSAKMHSGIVRSCSPRVFTCSRLARLPPEYLHYSVIEFLQFT